MKKTDTFGVFTQSPFPTALLSSDAHILSRNEKALTISRKFRCRSNFACCLPEGYEQIFGDCQKSGRSHVLSLNLPQKGRVDALLIPSVMEDTPCFVLILLSDKPTKPSKKVSDQPATRAFCAPNAFDTEAGEDLFAPLLRRCFILGLGAPVTAPAVSIEHACSFLNRFSENLLKEKGLSMRAKCTTDCTKLPLPSFTQFSALLAGICLFCLLGSADQKLNVLFYVEHECAAVRLTYPTKEDVLCAEEFPLCLFAKSLQTLGWSIIEESSCNGKAFFTLRANTAMPAGSIRTEDELLAKRLEDYLLAQF
ncbi:MAG: hypothetical protein IJZ37_03750 [Clostridia bacterium]|nr:hypothetical protein [Clostridia bacterium]